MTRTWTLGKRIGWGFASAAGFSLLISAVAVSAVWVSPERPASVTEAPGVKWVPLTVTPSPTFPEAEPSEMARSLAGLASVAVTVSETGAGGLVTVHGVSSSRM